MRFGLIVTVLLLLVVAALVSSVNPLMATVDGAQRQEVEVRPRKIFGVARPSPGPMFTIHMIPPLT